MKSNQQTISIYFYFQFLYCQKFYLFKQKKIEIKTKSSSNSNARSTFDYSQFDNESPNSGGTYPTLPRVPSSIALRNGTANHETQAKKIIDLTTDDTPSIPRVPSISQLRQMDEKPRSIISNSTSRYI